MALTATDFPSHTAYVDDQSVETRLQSNIGDFMFSAPNNNNILAPATPLSSIERTVPCMPVTD